MAEIFFSEMKQKDGASYSAIIAGAVKVIIFMISFTLSHNLTNQDCYYNQLSLRNINELGNYLKKCGRISYKVNNIMLKYMCINLDHGKPIRQYL